MTDNAAAGAGGNTGTDNSGAGGNTGSGGTAPWYDKLATPELVGHLQTHGWDKKTPTEVAIAAAQSHYSASKLIGADPSQVLKLPKDAADEAGWKTVYERLGVPKDATGYKFDGLKFADGKPPEKDFTDWVSAQALALKMNPNQALQFAQSMIKRTDDAKTSAAADDTAKRQVEVEALRKNWGKNIDQNLFVATRAATALGVSKETVDALAKLEGVGYAKVMEMFHTIGSTMGEANFIGGGNAPAGGIMSLEQAKTAKAGYMADTAWVQRYRDGDKTARREMEAVNVIIAASMSPLPQAQ